MKRLVTLCTLTLALGISACAGGPEDGEHYPNGDIYVTDIVGDGCTYDFARQGVVFEFNLTGHKSADLIAELHRSRGSGPLIGSSVLHVRNGNYHNPVTIVVHIDQATFDSGRTKCLLQTQDLGSNILRAP